MPSKPSSVVALIALVLGVWAVVFWLYHPAEVDLGAAPITSAKGQLEGASPLAALEPIPAAVEAPPLQPTNILNNHGTPELPPPPPVNTARTVTKPTKVIIPPEFTSYTVQKGDVSFPSIARRVYGDARFADAIARANPFVTPTRLFAGKTVLRIPKDPTNVQGKEVTIAPAGSAPSADPAPRAESGGKTYTVQPGDTLSAIAKKFYGKPTQWPKIVAANSKTLPDPSKLKPGMELVIPE
ncbi:hypothetical protein BH11PLA1_BH11PLA1_07350 [soil metagenome]